MSTKQTLDSNDWNDLAPHFAALLAEDLFPEHVPDWLRRWSDLEKIVWEMRAGLKKAKTWDVTDEAARQRFNGFTAGTFSHFKIANQSLKLKLLNIPDYIPTPSHFELLRRLRNEADLYRAENVPLQAELSDLESTYDALVQEVSEGYAVPEGPETAWRARNQRWSERRAIFDELFMKLLTLRRQLAHNAGLPDYRAYRWREMGRLDYTPDECLSFHHAVAAEIVPLAQRLLDAQRRGMQLNRLRPWDLEAIWERRNHRMYFPTTLSFEAAMARVFSALDPDLGAIFGRMREGFLDLGTRRGKAQGGEEWLFPVTGVPYVRVDADGTAEGIKLLLHECGHAFHDALSLAHQDLIWNTGGPTEFEEFAAISLCYLANACLQDQGIYSAAEADQSLIDLIEEAIVQWVPYIALVDAFQHWIYTTAPENVRAADLDAQWVELSNRFRPDLDWTGMEAEQALGWQQVGLLFQSPFYFIEYGLAHLGALQVWRNMVADPAAAWQAYRYALALGNTRPLRDLYRAAGAELPFDRGVVGKVIRSITKYLDDHASWE